jgi:hypothetical protein
MEMSGFLLMMVARKARAMPTEQVAPASSSTLTTMALGMLAVCPEVEQVPSDIVHPKILIAIIDSM